jgi:plasmid stabilization system protein ParE
VTRTEGGVFSCGYPGVIWYFLATQSSNIDVADRVIESITARFALLAHQPDIGRRRDEDLRPAYAVSWSETTSLRTALTVTTS